MLNHLCNPGLSNKLARKANFWICYHPSIHPSSFLLTPPPQTTSWASGNWWVCGGGGLFVGAGRRHGDFGVAGDEWGHQTVWHVPGWLLLIYTINPFKHTSKQTHTHSNALVCDAHTICTLWQNLQTVCIQRHNFIVTITQVRQLAVEAEVGEE